MSLPNKKFGTLFVAVAATDGLHEGFKPGRYLRRATIAERLKAERATPPVLTVKVYGVSTRALWLSEAETTRWLTELAEKSHAETYPAAKGE